MGIVKHYLVNDESKVLTFLDLRFYPCPDGSYVPSSSTILDAYPKSFAFFQWLKEAGGQADEIRDAAADKGSTIHKLTEMYDNGEEVSLLNIEGNIDFRATEWAAFEKYVQFSEKFKPEIEAVEVSLVSQELGYGGTLDRILKLNGKRYLVDIKTGNAVHNHFWLQAASYVKLYNQYFPEVPIDNVAILHLNAKTRTDGTKGAIQGKGWQMIFPPKDIEYYWNLFQHTKALWLEENEDAKPRNITYQISHKK